MPLVGSPTVGRGRSSSVRPKRSGQNPFREWRELCTSDLRELLPSGTVLHTAASNVNLLVLSKLVADHGADLGRRPSGDDGAQCGIMDGAVTTSRSSQRGGDAWQHRVRGAAARRLQRPLCTRWMLRAAGGGWTWSDHIPRGAMGAVLRSHVLGRDARGRPQVEIGELTHTVPL